MEDGVEEIFEHTLTTIEGKRLKLKLNKKIKDPNFDWANVDLDDLLKEAREIDDPLSISAIQSLRAFENA